VSLLLLTLCREHAYAYEVGCRIEPAAAVSLSVAAFFNRYDNLYSVEAVRGTMTYAKLARRLPR
jgi:hypothetical protein